MRRNLAYLAIPAAIVIVFLVWYGWLAQIMLHPD